MVKRGQGKDYAPETMLCEIASEYRSEFESKIVAGIVDNEIKDLQQSVGEYKKIEFIERNSTYGLRIYNRSVLFLLIVAVKELYPDAEVIVEATVNRGLYCTIETEGGINEEKVKNIEQHMRKIVAENRKIERKVLPKEEALKLFKNTKQIAKVNIISQLNQDYADVYYCGEAYDYLFGEMLDETGSLGEFALDLDSPGVLLRMPLAEFDYKVPEKNEQPKFKNVLMDSEEWAGLLECKYVADLNRFVRMKGIGEIIRLSEALQEKKIIEIANDIADDIDSRRLVLIAGPSSSGKTSFAQRLKTQLRVNNIKALSISMDDYYIDRELTPRTPDGKYDFERIDALNVELFNEHLKKLLAGESVSLPHYDFVAGKRIDNATAPICLAPRQPIIIEGIHGLNEKLTASIPREQKYKVYISALTPLNLDAHNRLHTTDTRLIRRMVRDYKYRGHSAAKTIAQWSSVRNGEEKYIFPFQEDADTIFNSSLIYELAALKKYAVKVLNEVSPEEREYSTVTKILKFLELLESIEDESDIPNNSIIREFIGGSCFFDVEGNLKE